MTVLVLHESAELLARQAEWLADAGEPLVALTSDEQVRPDRVPAGYAEVVRVLRYARSAAVERAALAIAARTGVSALVATGGGDLVRAGALREHLGLPGQGRDAAVARRDLVTMREHLSRAGVPVLPAAAVQRPADLCRHAHRWGPRLRVRHRRADAWPTAARLTDDAAVRRWLRESAGRHDGPWPGLMVEPDVPLLRLRPLLVSFGDAGPVPALPVPAEPAELAAAAVAALPGPADGPVTVRLRRTSARRLLVDSVDPVPDGDPELLRARTRAQAGLHPREAVS